MVLCSYLLLEVQCLYRSGILLYWIITPVLKECLWWPFPSKGSHCFLRSYISDHAGHTSLFTVFADIGKLCKVCNRFNSYQLHTCRSLKTAFILEKFALFGHLMPSPNTVASNKRPPPSYCSERLIFLIKIWKPPRGVLYCKNFPWWQQYWPETALLGHLMPSPNTITSNKCPSPSQRKVIFLIKTWALLEFLWCIMKCWEGTYMYVGTNEHFLILYPAGLLYLIMHKILYKLFLVQQLWYLADLCLDVYKSMSHLLLWVCLRK